MTRVRLVGASGGCEQPAHLLPVGEGRHGGAEDRLVRAIPPFLPAFGELRVHQPGDLGAQDQVAVAHIRERRCPVLAPWRRLRVPAGTSPARRVEPQRVGAEGVRVAARRAAVAAGGIAVFLQSGARVADLLGEAGVPGSQPMTSGQPKAQRLREHPRRDVAEGDRTLFLREHHRDPPRGGRCRRSRRRQRWCARR